MNKVKSLNRQTLGCREILRKSSAVCIAVLLSQYASGVFADTPDEPVEQQNMNQPAAVENAMPGKAFLHSLEKKFGSAHFRPPFVQTIPFQEIQVVGLGNALVEAVGQRFPNAY